MFASTIIEILGLYLKSEKLSLSFSLGIYVFLGLVLMMYPFSGLLADVYCGRYKIIVTSIIIIWCGVSLFGIVAISYALTEPNTFLFVINGLAYVICLIGFSGFQSNYMQFGLDQLLDVSSEKISSFLHWCVWIEYVGEMIAKLLVSLVCKTERHTLVGLSAIAFFTLSTLCVFLTYFTHKSFHRERISSNPYWNVWKVLSFAAKHNKPLRYRSAFTYSDDVKPPRIDFAKRKYGGPFETEVVEDVKTLLRIVLMLFATTPVFFLEVPTSYLFMLFGLHLRGNTLAVNCSYEWILFETGNLAILMPVLTIPVYLLFIHPHIKKWVPRIISRLGIGITLMVAMVVSMFIIQAVAISTASSKSLTNNSICLLLRKRKNPIDDFPQPTQVLLIPNLFYGIAAPMINITIYEFLTAQSPHTMKGLLFGILYALKGLFIILGSVVTAPFAQEKLWGDQHGMFDCGFYYYLTNSVLAVFGLVMFILVARWYHYRERDDPPYRHQYAEDYYSRYASQPTKRLIDGHNLCDSYGTTDQ